MSHRLNTDADYRNDRKEYTNAIVESDATGIVVVAGPGTGKTTLFRRAFERAGGGLALTFINAVADRLKDDLHGLADAATFHSFCKRKLHETAVDGLTSSFSYYPALPYVVAQDCEFLLEQSIGEAAVESVFQNIGESSLLECAVVLGSYYDAVSHNDAVYRMLKYYEGHEREIPAYPLVAVDEYQDFNRLETCFIEVLSRGSRVLVVGDDDQALYDRKSASPDFIRELWNGRKFESRELPYCSRCTKVIVKAVHRVAQAAMSIGALQGRVNKRFEYFPLDKREDSLEYPRILWADCSVQRKNAPYVSRYVLEQLRRIPREDLEWARGECEPAALVIGPKYFASQVDSWLKNSGIPSTLRTSTGAQQPRVVDGYKMLVENIESVLGWRVLCYCCPGEGTRDAVLEALNKDVELPAMLPDKYIRTHAPAIEALRKLAGGGALSIEEKDIVELLTGEPIAALLEEFGTTAEECSVPSTENVLQQKENGGSPSHDLIEGDVVCTTILGAKGLSAQHVFVVGLNEEHLPRSNQSPTDTEIRQFIVALTRTRKACHLVSCRRFGNTRLADSVFLSWVDGLLENVVVDRKYFS